MIKKSIAEDICASLEMALKTKKKSKKIITKKEKCSTR